MNASLIAALRQACGDAAVLTEPDAIAPFVTDWKGTSIGCAQAVVRPATTAQVADVVRACGAADVPIVPQGGNTGLATGATPLDLPDAVVVNLSRMREIVSIDPLGNTMIVEAGAVLSDVQEAARVAHRYFPLSLAAEGSAEIGGLIATNAGGTAVLRYGSMRALVLGLEVVLPDGTVADGMRALYKDNAGYDWKQLFIGSEGTLGIITRAVLRLFPQPRASVTAMLGVATAAGALRAFSRLRELLGETLTACELIPERAFALRTEFEPALRRPLRKHPWYLLIEAASSLSSLTTEAEEALAALEDDAEIGEIVMAQAPAHARVLWDWRETISESEKRAGPSLKHDVSVAVADVPSFIERATAAVEAQFPGTRVLAFGHMGDGNIHFNVQLPADAALDREAVSAAVYEFIAQYRGSITAEHGIGRYRRAQLLHHRSAAELEIMKAMKGAIDPRDRMNPGAVLRLGRQS